MWLGRDARKPEASFISDLNTSFNPRTDSRGLATMVSREEIRWVYRALLGREPEDEAAYGSHLECTDFDELRHNILSSAECVDKLRREISASTDGHFTYFRPMTVFIHIPKTGGTALHEWFCRMLRLPYRQIGHEEFLHRLTLAELNQIGLLCGHFSYQEAMAMPRAEKALVASFRDPVARLISLYRFFRSHPPGSTGSNLLPLARTLPIEEFFADPVVRSSHEIDNRYLRAFTEGSYDIDRAAVDRSECLGLALSRISRLDAIAITEQLALSAELIAARFGFENSEPPARLQVTDDFHAMDLGFDCVESIEPTENLRALLQPLVEYDTIIYNYARDKFERQRRDTGHGRSRLVGAMANVFTKKAPRGGAFHMAT